MAATSTFGAVEALREFNANLPDLRPRLAEIEAETLVIAGEGDFICGPAQARVVAGGIRRARLVLLREAGHMIFVEQPERFRSESIAFL